MNKVELTYELNRTYMIIHTESAPEEDDFRYRMLKENRINGLLKVEYRRIDSNIDIMVDVTGKQTLLNYVAFKGADREEIRELFSAVHRISEEMERLLIDESGISLRPEMIFRDMKTGKYEFICDPQLSKEGEKSDNLKALLQFLMQHIDVSDEQLVTTIYGLNDIAAFGALGYSALIEKYTEGMKPLKSTEDTSGEEDSEMFEDEPDTEEEGGRIGIYIPSFKEIGAFSLCLAGLIMAGYNLYMKMLMG